ncbi:tRNA-splicing endonuclease subunit [Zalaria obscura]|uniref:tRNA-splicing endonuclease subunit n=1 Tax=Zalaria obscura TaxID=2024903 RepID=A0ACC3SCQ3_9PEZI
MAEITVSEPFPIFQVAHRYLLYDVNTVTYARRTHNITGVLIGGLPQAPQQNVFSGIPLELMPEEARLLVEKGVSYIVDDVAAHRKNFLAHGLSAEEKKAFMRSMQRQGVDAAKAQQKKAVEKKKDALKKAEKKGASTENWNDVPDDMFAGPRKSKAARAAEKKAKETAQTDGQKDGAAEDETLFGAPANPVTEWSAGELDPAAQQLHEELGESLKITPTTSYPPIRSEPPPPGEALPLPEVPSSYPVFKHMHENGYFLAPGLRFGCQYMAYPGDPLRFHSHFLCNGMDWDEEFDLLRLVGGGRLGTGVKKGYLIGGEEKKEGAYQESHVRAFCIEWGGM